MLTCLRVRHLAIIDELEVELGPGLNVITGETGAGKSILVQALGLVLGERGRAELVRGGAKQAEVEALFDLQHDPDAIALLEASGLPPEPELVVRRVVNAAGRTRAYLNGRLASAGQLAELVGGLVDVSSQHEHHTLVDPATHLSFLDAFGKLEGQRDRLAAAHDALRTAERSLTDALSQVANRAEREDLLRFQIGEIEDLAPEPGELEKLKVERNRLRHAERLVSAAGGAHAAIYEDDGSVSEQLGRIAQQVREAAELDPALAPAAESLDTSLAQLEEVARELGRYAEEIDVEPTRLQEVEERAHRLSRLVRKYGGDLDAALEHRDAAQQELDALDDVQASIEALETARDEAWEKAAKAARGLSKQRRAIADGLGKAISAELSSLGMGGARVEVQIEKLEARTHELTVDGAKLTERGIDRVEFLIAPNPGEEPRALRKIASGGELSRAMLAIKRVLAGVGRAGLYVFDEVDSGVGGAVAEVIGQKLADVAEHHQVICITHLAPIAVYATRHFRVHKDVTARRTRSRIEQLDDSERLSEIARMLGGIDITESTKTAAADLMANATVSRAQRVESR